MSLVETNGLGETSPPAGRHSPSYVRERYPAIPATIPAARRAVSDLAIAVGAGEEQLEAIRLACSEALTNVVLYAYPPGQAGDVHVTARIASGELWVLIADDGHGIQAMRESDGLGLGLALIAQLSDGFSIIERSTGGTELQMRFMLSAHGWDEDDQDVLGSSASATRPASSRFSTTR